MAKSEKANISCSVDANPADVSFRWLFNNSAESLDVASSHISKAGTTSLVTYTPRTEMDYGTLLCWARNSIGDQRVPCVFHIIAAGERPAPPPPPPPPSLLRPRARSSIESLLAGRPDPVNNCTVANISMTSFSLKCSEGFNGGLPQSFVLEVLEINSQELKANVTSLFPRFSVIGLEPGAQYHALVYSFNPKGKSDPLVVQASTLRLPEKQLTSEKGNDAFPPAPSPGPAAKRLTAANPLAESRSSMFRMTPLMTVAAIVGGALLLVVASILLVLRLQCTAGGRRKRRKSSQEAVGSPANKLDQSGCDSADSDEKNPDIIPQPDTGTGPPGAFAAGALPQLSFPRRMLIRCPRFQWRRRTGWILSTRDSTYQQSKRLRLRGVCWPPVCRVRDRRGTARCGTGSPCATSRSITTPWYVSPHSRTAREPPLTATFSPPQVSDIIYPGGGCTLPRNHWLGGPYSSEQRHPGAAPPVFTQLPTPLRIPPPAEEEATPETPLMVAKRESTV